MKKTIVSLVSIVLLAAACGAKTPPPATNQQVQQSAKDNKQNNNMNNDIKSALEDASEEATSPIFDEVDPKQFPVKFLDAMQVGNHAAYVKSQQEDADSINFVLLNYDLEKGGWRQFGQDSSNFIFPEAGPDSQEAQQGIKDKVAMLEDKYFSKSAVLDFYRDLKASNMDAAKALISKQSPVNLPALVAQYPILLDNSGYSVYENKVVFTTATVNLQVIGNDKTSKHLIFNLVKEGTWKIQTIAPDSYKD
ncbi:MAG: hypothetical protein HY918_05950 [Candidatus Doudnabacteria bacterium]|nr:hypothetical protein [Candidatus Doudnabacteria bacterium]